jgi:hypothetical protein
MTMFILGLLTGFVLCGLTSCAVVKTTLHGIESINWEDDD